MNRSIKYILSIVLIVPAIMLAAYFWQVSVDASPSQDDYPIYDQCEKVFVGKTPHVCYPGELIYIDAEVAEQYCTDEVFVRTKSHVYCVYNGHRPDRTRTIKKFKKREINR